jgi:hypothetical protein
MARGVSSKAGKRKATQEVEFQPKWSPRAGRTKIKEVVKAGSSSNSSIRGTPCSSLPSPSKRSRLSSTLQGEAVNSIGDEEPWFEYSFDEGTPWGDSAKFKHGKARR